MTAAEPDPVPAQARARRGDRRRVGRRRRGRRLVRAVVAVAVLVPLLGLAYFAGLAAVVGNDVRRVDVLRPGGPEILSPADPADTYLLVGTGLGNDEPDITSTISTTVLLHVRDGDGRAVAVVLPARGYIDVPGCRDDSGQAIEPYGGRLDSVLPTGGAGCLVATVQQLTGVAVDHYVEFAVPALADVVEAVGEVSVCLPSALPVVGLPAGAQRLDGSGALALLSAATDDQSVRAAQQRLLGAVVDRVGAPGRVLHPVGTTRMLTAAGDALTLDVETGWGDLQRLVRILSGLGSERVEVLSTPLSQTAYRPADGSAPVDLLDAPATRALIQSLATGSLARPGLEAAAVAGPC